MAQKIWIFPVLLLAAGLVYLWASKGSNNSSIPELTPVGSELVFEIDPEPKYPVAYRTSIILDDPSISGESLQQLRELRPSFLLLTVNSTTLPNLQAFLDLNNRISSTPWLKLDPSLTEQQLDSIATLLAENQPRAQFVEVVMEKNQGGPDSFKFLSDKVGDTVRMREETSTPEGSQPDNHSRNPLFLTLPLNGTTEKETEMRNQVTAGSLHLTTPDNTQKQLSISAYRTAKSWAAALKSNADMPLSIGLKFPNDGRRLPEKATVVAAATPDKPLTLKQDDRTVMVDVPPHAFVVITQD